MLFAQRTKQEIEALLRKVPPSLQKNLVKALEDYVKASLTLANAWGRAGVAAESVLHMPRIEGEPLNLVLVRHGESVGNERKEILKKDAPAETKAKYKKTPNDELRLTSKGRWEAKMAGEWIAKNLSDLEFSALFCSDYIRATETAGIVGKKIKSLGENKGVRWRSNALYGERPWGSFEALSEEEQAREYEARKRSPRRWTPRDGAAFSEAENRVRLGMGTLHRKYCLKNVLIATHGELSSAFMSVIERLDRDALAKLIGVGIPNACIIQYSRVHPKTGEIYSNFQWVRMACPWDPKWKGQDWSGTWRRVQRPEYTSEELLAQVSKYEQIYDAPFSPPVKRAARKSKSA